MQRRTLLTGTALGVAGATLGITRPAQARAGVLAILGVTVIDASGGARRGQTVLVQGQRVLDAGPAHQVPVPHDATSPPVSPLAPAAEPAAAAASQPPAQPGRQAPDAKSVLTVPHNDGDVSVSPLAPVAGQTSGPSPQVAQPPPDDEGNEVVLPFAPATGQASEPSKSEVR